MTDYGTRPARRPWLAAALTHVAVLGAIGVSAAVASGTWLKDRKAAIATAGEWGIAGQPCREISKADFDAQALKAPREVEYDGLTIGRQNGHIMCTAVTYGGGKGFGTYPVCQLTSPAIVRAATRKGERYFSPGFGQPVTVSAPKGEPRCVLASHFTMN